MSTGDSWPGRSPRPRRLGAILGIRGVHAHGRIIGRTGFLDQGAGGEKVLQGGGDILIGDGDLFFERVQLRVLEHFPPFAFDDSVAGLGQFPTIGLLEGGGCLDNRRLVTRRKIAAVEKRQGGQRRRE